MKIFGTEQIVLMIVFVVLMALGIFFITKFVPKDKMYIPMKIIAAIGLVLIVVNRIIVAKSRNSTFLDFLPNTFCSMMGFVAPLVVLLFKPNTKIFQYAIFAGMIGGLLTFIYPDFIIYFDSVFNMHFITGYLYHTFMLLLFLLAIISKYFVPTFKKWFSLPVGLAFMVVVGVFGNNVLNQENNMYLNAPLIAGTGLTWYLVDILFLILYTFIIQVYEMCTLNVKEWSVVKLWNCVSSKCKSRKAGNKNADKLSLHQTQEKEIKEEVKEVKEESKKNSKG